MSNPLENWKSLNDFLRHNKTTEEDCERLLREEEQGKARTQFLLRIQGRFNVLRAKRERQELFGKKATAK